MMDKKYLQIQNLKNKGEGVITLLDIPPNVPIIEFGGKIYNDEQLPLQADDFLQIGSNTYLSPSGGIEYKINHSCSPNCVPHITGNRAVLYSLFLIKAGTELTYDYSLSSTENASTWSMSCSCGTNTCRQQITGFPSIDMETKQFYLKQNLIPLYQLYPSLIRQY